MLNGEIGLVPTFHNSPRAARVAIKEKSLLNAMGEFFSNVSRYPKYLITIILGVFTSAVQPLIRRSTSNPVTAIALIASLISGLITMAFLLREMVFPAISL